ADLEGIRIIGLRLVADSKGQGIDAGSAHAIPVIRARLESRFGRIVEAPGLPDVVADPSGRAVLCVVATRGAPGVAHPGHVDTDRRVVRARDVHVRAIGAGAAGDAPLRGIHREAFAVLRPRPRRGLDLAVELLPGEGIDEALTVAEPSVQAATLQCTAQVDAVLLDTDAGHRIAGIRIDGALVGRDAVLEGLVATGPPVEAEAAPLLHALELGQVAVPDVDRILATDLALLVAHAAPHAVGILPPRGRRGDAATLASVDGANEAIAIGLAFVVALAGVAALAMAPATAELAASDELRIHTVCRHVADLRRRAALGLVVLEVEVAPRDANAATLVADRVELVAVVIGRARPEVGAVLVLWHTQANQVGIVTLVGDRALGAASRVLAQADVHRLPGVVVGNASGILAALRVELAEIAELGLAPADAMARRIALLHRPVLLAVAVAKPPVAVALAAIGVDVAGHAFHAATGGLVAAQPLVQSAVPVPPALRNAGPVLAALELPAVVVHLAGL